MGEDIPTTYDIIVVGTGMTESIVAAAASRVGQRVLHLDSNSYYGDLWATFNFKGIEDWITDCKSEKVVENAATDSCNVSSPANHSLIKVKSPFSPISNIEEFFTVREVEKELQKSSEAPSQSSELNLEQLTDESGLGTTEVSGESKLTSDKTIESKKKEAVCWNRSTFLENSRKFNLDLAPKLLFAKGSLVELLISSNIGRYTEFRSVTRVLTWINNRLQPVPCSRADVFSTTDVSVVEKRMLMKLLTSFSQSAESSNEFEGFQNKTFLEYLKSKKLPSNLVHYVLHAIAMGTDKTSFKEGLSRSQLFLSSLGRYSNSPFLWPMYGSGELPQCFCRLCAVFGGIYHLQKGAESLIISESDNTCKGVLSNGQTFSASNIVLGVNSYPETFFSNPGKEGLSRGIFIIDRSILASDKEQLTLLQYPIDNKLVTVIEVGPATCSCPSGLYVVHMTCKQNKTAKEDLLPIVSSLFTTVISVDEEATTKTTNEDEAAEACENTSSESTKPHLLWGLYFNMLDTSSRFFSPNIPSNIHLCSGPDDDLDFESSVSQAKSIFSKICPDEEFLPRAPDPEEIILDDPEPVGQEKNENENETSEQEKDNVEVPEVAEIAEDVQVSETENRS